MSPKRQASLEDLSPRQRQVFGLMARGLTNGEIAGALGVQAATVKTHVSRILGLLDVSTRTEAVGLYGRLAAPTSDAPHAPDAAFDDRPSVAVMPFTLVTKDETLARLGLALTEDLTQRLALWHLFPVLARCATWTYHGKTWEPSAVGRNLGARYLVEGSVEPSSQGVHISVNLVDTESLALLWGDRFVVGGPDLITAQSEVCSSIIAALYPKLIQAEFERHIPREPSELGAWELGLLGLSYLYHPRQTGATNERAKGLFHEAAALDPQFVLPHFGQLFCGYVDLVYQWADDPIAMMESMQTSAQHAIDVDPKHPHALLSRGLLQGLSGDGASARESLSAALRANPCDAQILESYGIMLSLKAGEYEEGVRLLERAERLAAGSKRVFTAQGCLSFAHISVGRAHEGLIAAEKAALNAPDDPWVCQVLAAARAFAGEIDAANAVVERLWRNHPHISPEPLRMQLRAMATPEIAETLIGALDRAGFA
jgi:TolB-like protein